MQTDVIEILNVPVATLGMEEALELCVERTKSSAGGFVCFTNVHSVTESHSNSSLLNAFQRAFLCVADGVPLVWVSRLRAHPVKSRVCGPDFMQAFLKREPEIGHAFIGGVPGAAESLARRFGIPASCYSPPMRPFSAKNAVEDWEAFLEMNRTSERPKVVWVGLGAPKQELWMDAVSARNPDVLFFGVGAAFDFLTDRKRRAPLWMQNSGLEWLFRLIQEPRRLWRRYMVTNTKFVILTLGESFSRFWKKSKTK